MFTFLKKPYPRNNDVRHNTSIVFISGLLVTIILIFIFSIRSDFSLSSEFIVNMLLFGFVTMGAMAVVELLLPSVFIDFFKEEKWNIGKNVLCWTILITLITLGNLFLANYLYNYSVSLASFFRWFYYTVGIGILVNGAFSMINYKRLLSKNEQDAVEMNKEIKTGAAEIHISDKTVKVVSENNKEEVVIDFDSLLYIESADNYCKIFSLKNNAVSSSMIRSTMKRIEEQASHPAVYRCHRAYIVNLKKVTSVKGNSQGYRLLFDETTDTVPVSRNAGKELMERLKLLSNR